MMYQLKKTIVGVRQFLEYNKRLIVEGNGIISFPFENKEIKIAGAYPTIKHLDIGGMYMYSHPHYFYYKWDSMEGELVYEVTDGYGLSHIVNDLFVCTKRSNEDYYKATYRLITKDGVVIFESESLPILYCFDFNGDLVSVDIKNKKEIHCFELVSGKLKWSFNAAEIAASLSISVFPQKDHNIICLGLSGGHESYLLGLDPLSGNKLWQVEAMPYFVSDEKNIYSFNFEGNKTSLLCIEGASGKYQSFDVTGEIESSGLISESRCGFCVKDNLLYISFYYQKAIAILDLSTKKIKHVQSIPTASTWIEEPKVFDHILYVMDLNKTLYVYEPVISHP